MNIQENGHILVIFAKIFKGNFFGRNCTTGVIPTGKQDQKRFRKQKFRIEIQGRLDARHDA